MNKGDYLLVFLLSMIVYNRHTHTPGKRGEG